MSCFESFDVEKIVAERKHPKTGNRQYLIKWRRFSSKYNTWQDAKAIRRQDKTVVTKWQNRPILTRKGRGKRRAVCLCNVGACGLEHKLGLKTEKVDDDNYKGQVESDPILKAWDIMQQQLGGSHHHRALVKFKKQLDSGLAKQKKNHDKRIRQVSASYERKIEQLKKENQTLMYALKENSGDAMKNLKAKSRSAKRAARGKRC